MNTNEFINTIDECGEIYKIVDGVIHIQSPDSFMLDELTRLEDIDLVFENEGDVDLSELKQIKGGSIIFKNCGNVRLNKLSKCDVPIKFNNDDDVELERLTQLNILTEFNNYGCVDISSLKNLPDKYRGFNSCQEIYIPKKHFYGKIITHLGKEWIVSFNDSVPFLYDEFRVDEHWDIRTGVFLKGESQDVKRINLVSYTSNKNNIRFFNTGNIHETDLFQWLKFKV